ncbi:MAG: hypothetical protein GEU95_01150 [Rhizobiales bacterium]|nr:hypothetical protein [Hyphomicrobiales bacterium]
MTFAKYAGAALLGGGRSRIREMPFPEGGAMITSKATARYIRSAGAISLACLLALLSPMRSSHAASDVFSLTKRAGHVNSLTPLSLHVPPGRYAVFAKVGLDQDETQTTSPVTVNCELSWARAVLDFDQVRLAPSGVDQLDNAVLPLQGVIEERRLPVEITLKCGNDPDTPGAGGKLSWRYVKITAIRVDGLLCHKYLTEKEDEAHCP